MKWSKRFYPDSDVSHWARIQMLFAQHLIALGGPAGMMLVVKHDWDARGDTIYMALPQAAPIYDGFTEIQESELPAAANLLVGDQREFEKRFQYDKRI